MFVVIGLVSFPRELRTGRRSTSGLYQRGQGDGYPLVSTGFHFEGKARFKVEVEVELAKFVGRSKGYRPLLPMEHDGNAIKTSIRLGRVHKLAHKGSARRISLRLDPEIGHQTPSFINQSSGGKL